MGLIERVRAPIKRIRAAIQDVMQEPPSVASKYKQEEERFKVAKLITILEDVEGEFSDRPRNYSKFNLDKNKNSKGYQAMIAVIDYLYELRGSYGNAVEFLAKDYFLSVYKYYDRFKRVPYLNQLRPSVDNRIRHEEYIAELEQEMQTDYWLDNDQMYDDITLKAKKRLALMQDREKKLKRDLELDESNPAEYSEA